MSQRLDRIESKADMALTNAASSSAAAAAAAATAATAHASLLRFQNLMIGDRMMPGDTGQIGKLTHLVEDVQRNVVTRLDGIKEDFDERKAEDDERRSSGFSRKWQFSTYLVVGLIVALAAYGFSLLPHP